jgi:hypothetical protein
MMTFENAPVSGSEAIIEKLAVRYGYGLTARVAYANSP